MEPNVTVAEVGENNELVSEARQRSLANLKKPWQKGQSGNPGGRPKKITDAMEKHLKRRDIETRERNTDVFVKAMFKRAIARSDVMAKEIWDRVEGPLEAESGSSAPVAIQIVIETVGGEK